MQCYFFILLTDLFINKILLETLKVVLAYTDLIRLVLLNASRICTREFVRALQKNVCELKVMQQKRPSFAEFL